jgi:MFS family permease
LAYGVGDLLFSPLTEIPVIGRNPVYYLTFIVFWVLTFPEAVVDSFGGLLALRFLLGFFGSPALANGGATIGDLVCYSALEVMLVALIVSTVCLDLHPVWTLLVGLFGMGWTSIWTCKLRLPSHK